MKNDETLQPPPLPDESDDDLRFAPPAEDKAAPVEKIEQAEPGTPDEAPSEMQPEVQAEAESLLGGDFSMGDSLDIDAALAAVATLDDLLAEQEAAEQSRIAQEQAVAEAKAERQARLANPERFSPCPPCSPCSVDELTRLSRRWR